MDPRFTSCHEEWVRKQERDLTDLLAAASAAASTEQTAAPAADAELRVVVENSLRLYEEYAARRRALAPADGPAFFCPPWCSAFENSALWMGGCRPTLFIRLLYSLSGAALDARLHDFLSNGRDDRSDRLSAELLRGEKSMLGLSARQLGLVDALHGHTLREEGRLTAKMATVQEDVADRPLLSAARAHPKITSSSSAAAASSASSCCWWNDGDVEAAIKSCAEEMAGLLVEADRLRVATVRALLTEILGPKQAVELLVAAKQLHLSIHKSGKQRDTDLCL